MLALPLMHWWRFASDAEVAAAVGAALLFCAVLTLLAERRRNRSTARGAAAGWMPWTPLFLAFAMMGVGLLALALPVVMQGR